MKHVLADDEATPQRLDDLDFTAIALLLELSSPGQGDAYDVLRGVLEQLSDKPRGRRSLN